VGKVARPGPSDRRPKPHGPFANGPISHATGRPADRSCTTGLMPAVLRTPDGASARPYSLSGTRRPPIVPCKNPGGRWQRTSLPHKVRHQPTRSGEDAFPWTPVAKTITIGHWHRGVIPSGKDPCGSAMPTVRDLEGTTSRVLPGGASPIPEGEALLRSIGVAALRHHRPTTIMAGARNTSTTRGFDVRTSMAPLPDPRPDGIGGG